MVADIEGQLGDGMVTLRGPLDRAGLALHVSDLPSQAERLAWLAATLPVLRGSGIVYCLTVPDTERVASWLQRVGIDALAYSGSTAGDDRLLAEQALLGNEVKALVATSALGMGFDKPDLGFVVHFQSPGSPVHYYQQVGRAGRQLDRSVGVLLAGHEGRRSRTGSSRRRSARSTPAEQVVELVAREVATWRLRDIEDAVNVRHSRLEAMLKILEVEGAVEREGSGWRRTLQPWAYDERRVARVTALRRHEQQVMRDYRSTVGCRMEVLRRVLDDADATPCGICDNCSGERLEPGVDRALVVQALDHLRRTEIVLAPRQRYPRGVIPLEHRVASARAVSRWGDGGWGGLVARASRSTAGSQTSWSRSSTGGEASPLHPGAPCREVLPRGVAS